MPTNTTAPDVREVIRNLDKQARLAAEAEALEVMQAEITALQEEVAAMHGEAGGAPAATTRSRTRQRSSTGRARTRGTVSVRDAIPQVLGHTPMTAAEITEAVQAVDGVKLSGKTPEATVAAFLATENKKGASGLVRRTAPGTYVLRGRARARRSA